MDKTIIAIVRNVFGLTDPMLIIVALMPLDWLNDTITVLVAFDCTPAGQTSDSMMVMT